MQDENVTCRDLGKVSFEHAVGCFGMSQLKRATCFPMPELERVILFRTFQFIQCLISARSQVVITACDHQIN